MEIIENKSIETEFVIDIICDCCGQSCKTEYGIEYLKMQANWGYGSDKKDFTQWTAQICEKCADEKFDFVKFKKELVGMHGPYKPSKLV